MPRVWDSLSAARFTSFFTCIPGLAIFGAPILYFGVSERGYGINLGLVGTLILLIAFTRILWPGWSTVGSYLNSLLGAWVIISPWIFGYADWLALTVLSVGAGAAVIGMSLFSASFTRRLRPGDY